MSSESDVGRRLPAVLSILWALLVLGLYITWRTDDVQPVLLSLGSRLCDLAVPVGLWLAHLPIGAWLTLRLRAIAPDSSSLEWVVRSSALGLGVAIGTAMLGALIGVSGPTWTVMSAIVCFGVGMSEWGPSLERLRTVSASLPSAVRTVPGFTAVVVMGLALLTVLTPAVSQDALHYHLEVPKRWLAAGGFVDVPGNVYSHFPMNLELLYLDGLALRGEIAAKAWHWLFAGLAAAAIRLLAGRFAGPRVAMWAPAIFLAVPSVFRVATWAYVEMGLIFFLVVGWDSIIGSGVRGRVKTPVVFAGVVIGLACGTKYTALPVALMVAILIGIQSQRCRWINAASFAGAAALTGGFWYVKNWVEVGNPVFPFLYSFFGGPGWDQDRADLFQASLAEWGEVGWWLPFSLTFDATFASIERFDGVVGPALLIALPLFVRLGWKQARVRATLALALGMMGLWLATTQQIRFLLPALAMLFSLIPAAIECGTSELEHRVCRVVLCGCLMLSAVSHLILFGREAPLAFAVGIETADQNRSRRLPGGDAELFARIPRHVGSTERVLFGACGNPVFLCDRPYHADSVIENHTLRRLLAAETARECAEQFASAELTHLLFRFELVFGQPNIETDLSLDEQDRLVALLNGYGELVDRADRTFLYRINPVAADQ